MKALVQINKSFDKTSGFEKKWRNGDFEEFFNEEGKYLDRLSKTTEIVGNEGEGFVVTFVVTVIKD